MYYDTYRGKKHRARGECERRSGCSGLLLRGLFKLLALVLVLALAACGVLYLMPVSFLNVEPEGSELSIADGLPEDRVNILLLGLDDLNQGSQRSDSIIIASGTTMAFLAREIKKIFKQNLLTKLAAAMVLPGLNAFKAQLDPNKVGGTAFIGISKPVIKAHGASNAEAIENAVGQAIQVARSGIVEDIQKNIDKMQLMSE